MRHAAPLLLALLALAAAGCDSYSPAYPRSALAARPPALATPPRTPAPAPAPALPAATILATDQNFDRAFAGSTVPVLVNFSARWCGPCHALAPVVDEFAADHPGRVKVIRVDFDQSPTIARRYNISALPALVWIRNGVIVNRSVGYRSRESLDATFATLGGLAMR